MSPTVRSMVKWGLIFLAAMGWGVLSAALHLEPWDRVAFQLFCAIVGSWLTGVYWRRTRLPFVTISLAMLSAYMFYWGLLTARRLEGAENRLLHWGPLGLLLLLVLGFRELERASRENPNRTFWSVISGRDIPHLRRPATPGDPT